MSTIFSNSGYPQCATDTAQDAELLASVSFQTGGQSVFHSAGHGAYLVIPAWNGIVLLYQKSSGAKNTSRSLRRRG